MKDRSDNLSHHGQTLLPRSTLVDNLSEITKAMGGNGGGDSGGG